MHKTLFVGCDVSSKENTVCLMDEDGKEVSYPIFPNTLTGAKVFEETLLKVMEEEGFSQIKIATEATSFLV